MHYLNLNAFYLGLLIFGYLLLPILVYLILSLVYKIKIAEVGVFASPWFALRKTHIKGTAFVLGWIPLSTHLKFLGRNADEAEISQIAPEDLPFAHFNKPKYVQKLFGTIPVLVYVAIASVLFFVLSTTSFTFEVTATFHYISAALKTMFSDDAQVRQNFIVHTHEMVNGKNVVAFAFLLFQFYLLSFMPMGLVTLLFPNESRHKGIGLAVGILVTLFMIWFALWKVPVFVFSFFAFSQSLVYLSSFCIGIFVFGILAFYGLTILFKSSFKNLLIEKMPNIEEGQTSRQEI